VNTDHLSSIYGQHTGSVMLGSCQCIKKEHIQYIL